MELQIHFQIKHVQDYIHVQFNAQLAAKILQIKYLPTKQEAHRP